MTEENSIDRLKKRLYRKGEDFRERESSPELKFYRKHAPEEWLGDVPEEKKMPDPKKGDKFPRIYIFIIILVLAALTAMGAAAWYLFGGASGSTKNINFYIEGQPSINGGDLARWDVVVSNNAKVPMVFANLFFEYPEGSQPFDSGSSKIITGTLRSRMDLGQINSGETKRYSFQAFVFGEKESVKSVKTALEYRLAGSNAILAKEANFELAITRSSLAVSIIAPTEVNAGDDFNIEVEVISQSKEIIHNVVMRMNLPDGFSFKNSSLPRMSDQNIWDMGDIAPNGRQIVKIEGTLEGEDIEEKFFSASAGILKNNELLIYGQENSFVNIVRQFLEVKLRTNLDNQRVVFTDDSVIISALWKNNLPIGVENATLKIFIKGGGVDEKTINPEKGFYIGQDKAAVWNATSYPQFSFVEPGEQGEINLRFRVPQSFSIRTLNDVNFKVDIEGVFSAPRRPPGYENVDITGTADIELKVATDLQLARQGVYNSTILPGYGPIPPKVAEETVYTIIWSLINTTNNVSNVRVSSSLPPYVVWKNKMIPEDANLTFNEETREIVWSLNILQSGTGIVRPAKEVQFQVGITPSITDVGKEPIIIYQITASAFDDFARSEVTDFEATQTTYVKNDPNFYHGMGRVVK